MSNITAHGFDIAAPLTAPIIGAYYPGVLVGTFTYRVSYTTHYGETLCGPVSSPLVLAQPAACKLTDIPTLPEGNVIARNIYRSNGAAFELVATIPDNRTTTHIDTNPTPTTPEPTASFASSVEIERGWIVNKRAPVQPYSTLACANPPSQCDQRSQFIFLTATGPGLGCILPASTPTLDGMLLTLVNSSPNDVTLYAGSGRTINGSATTTLTAGSNIEYILAGNDFLPCGSSGGGPSGPPGPPGPPSVITLVMDDNAPIPKYPTSSAEGVWHGTDARASTTAFDDTVIGNGNIVTPTRAISYTGATIIGAGNTVNGKSTVCVGTRNNVPAGAIVVGTNSSGSTDSLAIGNSTNAPGLDSIAIGKQARATEKCISIGYTAGGGSTTAANCIFIGDNVAPLPGNSCRNVIVIGSNAEPGGGYASSNQITLGDPAITTLWCNATTITALSDARDKTNIRPLTNARQFIDALNPVTFDWDRRDKTMQGVTETGFIAQELAIAQADTNTHVPGLVQMDNPDMYYASYGKLLPHLVQAVRELSAEVASLRSAYHKVLTTGQTL